MVVEYRGGEAAKIEYREKETGKAAVFCKMTHNVEAGSKAFQITERLPDDTKVDQVRPSLKKGQMAIFRVQGFYTDKGTVKASGTLEALID